MAARRRLELAWYCCRSAATRRRLIEQTLALPRPKVDGVWCSIDAAALRSWMLTTDAQAVPRRKDGTSYGASGWHLANDLLQACTDEGGNGEVLWLQIEYRHATGTGSSRPGGSRTAGEGVCDRSRPVPTALPHPTPSPLGRFGWELDDAAAYIRIVAMLVPRLCDLPWRLSCGRATTSCRA